MITLDTSGLVAVVSPTDRHHQEVVSILRSDPGPRLIPAGILAEIGYLLEQRAGPHLVRSFVRDLEEQAYVLDCGEENLPRVRQLMDRYHDLPLGLADAVTIACAERHEGRVLSLDHHFAVVGREGTITVLPSPSG
jgi:predicted nucleic acid-binding protein